MTLEAVAEETTAPSWFQLYVFRDRGLTRSLAERAEQAGYEALVLTVDAPVLGRREKDIRNGFGLPPGMEAANLVAHRRGKVAPSGPGSGLMQYFAAEIDPSLQWTDVDWLRSVTSLPILVKGLVRGDDARLAVEHGAAGVIVSNHGGRQLDTAPATIDVVGEVSEAVDGQGHVLMDGGIRRGTDMIKALSLGADAVLVGRPVLWGLTVGGASGVENVLGLLCQEFDQAMALCGCASVAQVRGSNLAFRPAAV